jgi:NAD(P)-dependent dehydrogenase (short-subunit alcohol dehydrogenase family)
MVQNLHRKVALVAGATRGAGRGIACALGEAGATVYCTGRSIRGQPSPIGRPETIEETAEMINACGGKGLWVQVDHTKPDQVKMLIERIKLEQNGCLDILVNDISGDWHLEWKKEFGHAGLPFWKHSLEKGLLAQEAGVNAHIITSHYAAQLMVKRRQGLIVEINDGNYIGYNNCGLFYSLMKSSAILLAHFMAKELRRDNVAAICLTPGWLKSERMLETYEVPEGEGESVFFIGRAVVALATDPNIMAKTGCAYEAAFLARQYGFTDINGTLPPNYRKGGYFENGNYICPKAD